MQVANERVPATLLDETFTIIIPAYNEERRIERVLKELIQLQSSTIIKFDVKVIIDGNDKTYELVEKYGERYPFIQGLKSERRRGMGGALKAGFMSTNADYVVFIDGDGAGSVIDVIKGIPSVSNWDIINFNRYNLKSNHIPFTRRILSRGFNILVRSVLGIHVKDTQSNYKIVNRNSLEDIVKRITITNAFFLTAIFYYAYKFNLKIIEKNIDYRHANGSKFDPVRTSLGHLISILGLRVRYSKLYKIIPREVVDLYYRMIKFA